MAAQEESGAEICNSEESIVILPRWFLTMPREEGEYTR